MVRKARLLLIAGLMTASGALATAAGPVLGSTTACAWQSSDTSHVIQIYPNPYSTWINVVYYRFYLCSGTREAVKVTRIDTYFHTSADPGFPITRRLEWMEIKATHSGPYIWGVNPGKSCSNACTVQATVYPNKSMDYASSWIVGVWCDNCWPATGDKYELNHKFIPNTWTLNSWP
jgi:hypothetical protein